jgi:hypothetical protein
MRLFSLNRICALFLIVTILATTVFAIPQKSYAQLVVTDPGNTGGTFLNLITCDGRWLKHTYDRRMVIFSELE